ncbi:hypothetical protein [Actinomadura latina]|uniref:Uncharacterized protein n=1 Tax=Actinomadura latina TaxID=163603 RepID=A0A846Z945_9ACTN|nr:hypothetical protein [Actinomadura latina]NKZ07095.1 hypothetical protein [Actinomadura latina]
MKTVEWRAAGDRSRGPIPQRERAVAVGCRYRDGQWWFWYVRTDVPIGPVGELNTAARRVRANVERTVS